MPVDRMTNIAPIYSLVESAARWLHLKIEVRSIQASGLYRDNGKENENYHLGFGVT